MYNYTRTVHIHCCYVCKSLLCTAHSNQLRRCTLQSRRLESVIRFRYNKYLHICIHKDGWRAIVLLLPHYVLRWLRGYTYYLFLVCRAEGGGVTVVYVQSCIVRVLLRCVIATLLSPLWNLVRLMIFLYFMQESVYPGGNCVWGARQFFVRLLNFHTTITECETCLSHSPSLSLSS